MREAVFHVNSPTPDLAALPASPQQRRAALVAIAALGAFALVTAPFARTIVGTFPGFVTFYGGTVLMGLAITATILFGQFALSRKPSLLLLSCGTLFAAIVFVPYTLAYPGAGTAALIGALPSTPDYLWLVWHTELPLLFVAYALVGAREGAARVGSMRAWAAVLGTVLAAYAAIQAVFAFDDVLPPLVRGGNYLTGVYVALVLVVLFSGTALVVLLRRSRATVVDLWLTVPASALLLEAVLVAFAGTRYSVGWYLSRLDLFVATAFLVGALLGETNRLARVLGTSERRLRGIVAGVADALVVVGPHELIAWVNPAAAALFGRAAEELAGTPVGRILPGFDAAAPVADGTSETTAHDAHGNRFPIELARGRPAHGEAGETILILRDITQRKRAEEAIRLAHDRAVEAADVKAQFLATMSHEIRTPINAVVGMSELLLQTPLSDEAREYAATVRDSAESLLAVVNDILDFSKIEAGRMELEALPFAPLDAVENAADILAAAARKKGLSLATHVAADVPRQVIGDADRLRQVLLNLIGNAVKFTAQGSVAVRASVEASDDERTVLRFAISDTGPGIAAELAERLFEPFRQADQSTRRRFGGTGLGLSISRRIVELMGGRIGFESAPGAGATFWFSVPFACVAESGERRRAQTLRGTRVLVVDEDAVARQVVNQYLQSWGALASSTANGVHALELARAAAERGHPFDVFVIDRRIGGDGLAFAARLAGEPALAAVPLVLVSGAEERITSQDARARGFGATLRKPIRQAALHDALLTALRGPVAAGPPELAPDPVEPYEGVLVLIAEDNPVNRRLALRQLEKLGYRAHAVEDGRAAIDAVAGGRYDLVLMDCQMPEVDGFEATRAIRRSEAADGRHVPIVAMTANALEGDREACLAAGMDAYLAKPVQLAALRGVVEQFTNGVRVAG